ncbi:O-antigen ligase family protein [Bdellovibrionota bacterium FG-2]
MPSTNPIRFAAKLAAVVLTFCVALVPLIVKARALDFPGYLYDHFTDWNFYVDIFSWYKASAVILAASILVPCLAWDRVSRGIHKPSNHDLIRRPEFAFVGIFGLLVILSTLFSEHTDLAIWGFVGQFEGCIIWLSYLVLLLAASVFLTNTHLMKWVISGLLIAAVVAAIIGLFQFYGLYVLDVPAVKRLIAGSDQYATLFNFTKTAGGTIYATMYHSNYVGSYSALVFPLSFALFLFSRPTWKRFCFGLLGVLLFALLIGCHSRAAWAGCAVASAWLIIWNVRRLDWKALSLFIGTCATIAAVMGYTAPVSSELAGRVQMSKAALADFFSTIEDDSRSKTAASDYPLEFLEAVGNTLRIKLSGVGLKLVLNGPDVLVLTFDGVPLPVSVSKHEVKILRDPYNKFTLNLGGEDGLRTVGISYQIGLTFYITDQGFRFKNRGALQRPVMPEVWFPSLPDARFNSRFYTWKRTLPLLKRRLWFGAGPGVFATDFPQNDFAGKRRVGHDFFVIHDKPHNGYLQIAHGSGVFALVCFLGLIGGFFAKATRLFMSQSGTSHMTALNPSVGLLFGLSASILAYLVAAIANDSVVSVAPVFWILLGAGFATIEGIGFKYGRQ